MKRLLQLLLAILGLAALLGAGFWMVRPRPSLDGVEDLIAAKQFDEAEERFLVYLQERPDDAKARLRLARLSLDRPEPRPVIALEQVQGLAFPDPRLDAEVRTVEGQARFFLRQFVEAESAWKAALKQDPKVPEAGWGLLNLYALQGRDDEARTLGLKLYQDEPDPHDRVQILLQLIRHDAHAISAEGVIGQLGPVVQDHPEDVHSRIALAQALIRDGKMDEAIGHLRQVIRTQPDRIDGWESYLAALVAVGETRAVEDALKQVPEPLQSNPRLGAARGWLASQAMNWPVAVDAYRRAWEDRPFDPSAAYRYSNALRLAGRTDDLNRLGPKLRAVAASRETLRLLYDEIDALPDVGRVPHPDPYKRLAEVLDQIGRTDEAKIWRTLAEQPLPKVRAY